MRGDGEEALLTRVTYSSCTSCLAAKKISKHPAILWKVLNVRDHLKNQQTKGKDGSIKGEVKEG